LVVDIGPFIVGSVCLSVGKMLMESLSLLAGIASQDMSEDLWAWRQDPDALTQ